MMRIKSALLAITLSCVITNACLAQTSIGAVDTLKSTMQWFNKNPPKADGSNFKARWEHTLPLDKYGWQLSSDTWNKYRSYWKTNLDSTRSIEHSNPILYYLRKVTDKTIQEIKATKVRKGAIIWKLYNMGYIIKTKNNCFGTDLNHPGSEELTDVLDFVIVSHIHSDHNDIRLLESMVKAGKSVYSPFFKKGTLITGTALYEIGDLSVRFTMNKQADVPVIASQISCGYLANRYTIYHIGDARSLEDLNPSRPVNLFILHIENAINIYDAVARVKPDVTVYDHVMELGHPVGKYRWSYQYTYNKIQKLPASKSYVLTWGEKLIVGK